MPLGRLGRADEIAAMIAFLASADASFTTGTAFVVDGATCSLAATTPGSASGAA